ncbi:muts 5 family protein [Clavulina sp. PMI_390]|nr:muts 5 family protein [Clavulina sp. PMI_390]
MLSLAIFAREDFETSTFLEDEAASTSHSISVNAYNFMRRQRAEADDPTLLRHHALIRLANYSSSDIPLCVSGLTCMRRGPILTYLLQMSAVGALLDHLPRVQAVGDLDHEGVVSLDIQRIEILALDQVMQINADALSSLQIFDDESHASMHSNRSKEGLSLFGILDFTKTNAGRTLLRQWCIRPLLSIPEIEARHDAVACFIRGENTPITDAMHGQLKGFKNAPRAFTRIKLGKGATIEWRTLVTFAYHAAMLMETLSDLSHTQDVAIIEKFRDSVDSVRLQQMGRLINERIDWETSENERRTCIRHGIDEELDKFKHAYYGLDQVLSRTALKIKKEIPPDSVESLNVLYFPQLGE